MPAFQTGRSRVQPKAPEQAGPATGLIPSPGFRPWCRSSKPYARVRELSKLPCARATTVLGLEHFRATADGGVLALSFVTVARETVEGRGALSGSLAGMFPARRRASKLVGKRWQFSKLQADPVRLGHRAQRGLAQTVRFPLDPSRRGGGRQGGQRTRSGRAGAWANSSQKLAVFGTTLAVGPARAAAHRTASAGAELVDKSRHFGGGGGRNGR